jgi:hypothetical protein
MSNCAGDTAATRVKIIKAVSGVAPGSHSRALAESL